VSTARPRKEPAAAALGAAEAIAGDGTSEDPTAATPVAGATLPGTAEDPIAAALAPLRERIDAIDNEIVALLNERAEIALEIGRVKDATGQRAIRDPKREAEVIDRVTRASSGLFPEPELAALYRTLIAATRKVQVDQRRRAKATPPDPKG
jgi:chorismate mutase / prephenate dehydratase